MQAISITEHKVSGRTHNQRNGRPRPLAEHAREQPVFERLSALCQGQCTKPGSTNGKTSGKE